VNNDLFVHLAGECHVDCTVHGCVFRTASQSCLNTGHTWLYRRLHCCN